MTTRSDVVGSEVGDRRSMRGSYGPIAEMRSPLDVHALRAGRRRQDDSRGANYHDVYSAGDPNIDRPVVRAAVRTPAPCRQPDKCQATGPGTRRQLRGLRHPLRHTTRVPGFLARGGRGPRAKARHPGHGLAAEGIERAQHPDRRRASTARSFSTSGSRATIAPRRPRSKRRAWRQARSPTSSSPTHTGTTSTARTSSPKPRSGFSARSTATTPARRGRRATRTAASMPTTWRRF